MKVINWKINWLTTLEIIIGIVSIIIIIIAILAFSFGRNDILMLLIGSLFGLLGPSFGLILMRPKLKLLLLDAEGNATKEIKTQPIITKKQYVKKKSIPTAYSAGVDALLKHAQTLASISSISPLISPIQKRDSPKDLVPIGIKISNIGKIPAEGVKIFLEFPEDCELVSEDDVIGGLGVLFRPMTQTLGGLVVDNVKSRAIAWVDELGNDIAIRDFRKVYVRFPEKSQEYLIKAAITQHRFPTTHYEFKIIINPQIEEVVEYVE
ncbi:MAG: hypothetical protein KKA79_05390 [Nanoarchaeota archaeon]|nr:hypothetical protein [Nanoarchaeota archaeon]MCG2718269.1 hypothetical protein [Nanoarchaeota archaeon]